MSKPSPQATKIAAVAATPLAVVLAGAMIYQASYAAFSGQTRNSGNDWSTGSIALTDDDAGSARFQVTNMLPEATDTKCLTITANASVPGTVKGYVVNPVFPSPALADAIKVMPESGTGGSFADCAGFDSEETVVPATSLSTLAAADDYDSAVGGWDVDPGTQSRTYQITWLFDTAAMTQAQIDDLQGDRAGLNFQWELQSN